MYTSKYSWKVDPYFLMMMLMMRLVVSVNITAAGIGMVVLMM